MSAVRRNSVFLFFAMVSASFGQERVPFIINGIETDEFPAVGIVGEESVGGFCTGTLISPNHVLTAAHCAEAILDIGSPDTGIFEVNGRVYRTASVEIISSYNSRTFVDDVAILVLSESVEGVEPAELSPVPPDVGEVVTLVGFGAQGTAEDGSDGSFGNKLVGTVTVDNVTENEFSWNFDDPTESNSAPGDSGGPLFIDTGFGFVLAGIVSSGTQTDAGLGDTSFNMRVDAYSDWISETVIATQAILDGGEIEQEPTEEESEPAEEPTEEEPEVEQPIAEAPIDEPAAEVPATETSGVCSSHSYSHGVRHRHRGHSHRRNQHSQACQALTKPGCSSSSDIDDTSAASDTEDATDDVTTSVEEESGAPTEDTASLNRNAPNRRRGNPRRGGPGRPSYR